MALAIPHAIRAQYVIGERDARARRVDSVFRAFDRTDTPGCAVGVYRDGAVHYARGYGLASLEHGIPLSPRTVLDVGSISKQFTAMAMLLLMQEGKLSLDDPIRTIFPELPPYTAGITWRRALSQTSGLRDLWTMWGQTGRTFAGDTVDALHVIARSAEPNYAPGARYLYTNTGWILAAQAVYRLTGQTLAQFAHTRLFTPLGMRDTRFLSDRAAIIPHLAESYSARGGSFRVQRNPYDGAIMGAGGLHTTIEDFGRWLDNYDRGIVGGREVLTTMTTATRLTDGSPATTSPGMAYGIGVMVGTLRGVRVISHGGSWGGFRGHFLRFPDQRMAVATFCNLATSGPDSLARKVAGIYLEEQMAPDSVGQWSDALGAAPRAPVATNELARYTGLWRHVMRGDVRRTRLAGDTLRIELDPATPLIPLGAGRFRTSGPSEVIFSGGTETPNRMFVRTGGDTVTYERAAPVALDAAALAEFAGEYRSDEVETTHRWTVEKGQLVVHAGYRRLGVLIPSYRDGFTRDGSVIDVQRDARGRITGFLVEAGRVRHLKFTRVR